MLREMHCTMQLLLAVIKAFHNVHQEGTPNIHQQLHGQRVQEIEENHAMLRCITEFVVGSGDLNNCAYLWKNSGYAPVVQHIPLALTLENAKKGT